MLAGGRASAAVLLAGMTQLAWAFGLNLSWSRCADLDCAGLRSGRKPVEPEWRRFVIGSSGWSPPRSY
jgi:hypothetical protein